MIDTSFVKATLNVNVLLPSWSCGTFLKLASSVSVLVIVPSPVESARRRKSVDKSGDCRIRLNVSLGSFTASSTIPSE